jgi:hypothetical protein
MTSTAEEKAFLRVAVAAIPRVAELIFAFSSDDRAGALETVERRFLAARLWLHRDNCPVSRICRNAPVARSTSKNAVK